MPRPRTKDPLQPLVDPIARRFAAEVAAAVRGYVETQVKREVEKLVGRAFAHAAPRGAAAGKPRATRIRPCRVPGCGKPSKGPRFDFFCAEHRSLPATEKAAIKAGTANGPAADAAAAAPNGKGRAKKAGRGKKS